MSRIELPRDGGCLCGRVRFRISEAPVLTMACHCKGCQRLTGGPFSVSVMIPRTGFAITMGEPAIGALHGPSPYLFCGWCMSWLFSKPERLPGLVVVRTTALDDPEGLEPYMETQTAEKLSWAHTPARESFERWPPPEAFPRMVAAFAAG